MTATQTTARNAFRVIGTTDDVTICELCGRDELRSTIVLAILDNDGNDTGERVHYGTTCGAKAAGWTITEINRRIEDAAIAKRAADEKILADRRAREFDAMAVWAANALGIIDRDKLRDIKVIMAFHASDAYAAFKAAEDGEKTAPETATAPVLLSPSSRPVPTDRLRKGESRPALTGRTQRRHEQRTQARTEQRPGRAVLGHMDRAIVAARNTNAGLMTVGEYLRGIGFPEAERLASAFGRACAKTYRANHNTEPAHAYAIANGRIRTQNGYADVADLLAGARAYKPTAAFLAEQQHTVARDLIAA